VPRAPTLVPRIVGDLGRGMTTTPSFAVVVPTIGRRPALARLLESLERAAGPRPAAVVVVDDRPSAAPSLTVPDRVAGASVTLLRSGGRGPAAARNRGARDLDVDWLVFLDDDVVVESDWRTRLVEDLLAADAVGAVASQGELHVPLPKDRRPTDWERDVAGLQRAAFITADMGYRRHAFVACGGFDEGFRHAYREDADLALRLIDRGGTVSRGVRRSRHPVGDAGFWVSVRRQRNNAADARMLAKHGRVWRRSSHAPRGRLPWHALTVGAALGAVLGAITRRRFLTALGVGGWAGLTASFAAARIAPGPRTPGEIARMALTSVVIPPAAVFHRLRGEWTARRPANGVDVVLFDRDGTLVDDVPANGDPEQVRLMPGARDAVGRLRAAGLRVGVVSNQHAVAQGRIGRGDVEAVNRRIDALVGPLDGWWYCPHDDGDRCGCRKPAPGLVLAAARAFGHPPSRCLVIGDTEADLRAAERAGARGVLVPNARTRRAEVRDAPVVAAGLHDAVDHVLDLVATR